MRKCSVEKTFRFGLIVAALSAVVLCGAPGSAATYYVRLGGNDASDGLAPATAFQTLVKASTVVTNGDTVYVGGGSYADSVVLDGIQASTAPVSFIADTDGTFTGDAGAVIILDKMLAVVNCNYVEFHKFTFQSPAVRPVIWKGSYDGLFMDCVFDGGGEPLLIKDGSVRLEGCDLTSFATDAIYVDGEVLLTLVGSTISNCGGEGIEISKSARVVLEGTTIENNIGDGITAAQTETYIDDGGVGASGGIIERLVAGKTRIIATGGSFDGYDSSLGAYGPGNDSEDADLYSNVQISTGATVPVQGSAYYAPGGSATVPNLTGTVNSMPASITMDPIDPGDAATNNDNLSIPLTDLGNNPYVAGRLTVGSSDGLDLPPGTYYFVDIFVTGGTLRISGPTTVYVTGRAYFTSGNATVSSGKPADFKLSVMGTPVQLSGSSSVTGAIYAPNSRISLSGTSHIYGMAVGNEVIMSGGGIHVDKSLTTYAAAVQGISGGSSSPAPPPGWTAIGDGEVDITGGGIRYNRRGVNIETAQSFTAVGGQFLNNVEWGLCLNGHCDLDNCTITDNGVGGLRLEAVNDVDCELTTLTIADNPTYGMYLKDCNLTFDSISLDALTFTTGSNYMLYAQGGSLTLDGVAITGGSMAAVFCESGTTLDVRNGSNFSASKYGIWANQSTVTIADSTLSGNEIGLYAVQNPSLDVSGTTTLSNNTVWGAKVDLTSTTGTTTTFSGATVNANASGLLFTGGASATVELPNTVIQNNTHDGLRFEGVDLTLDATTTSSGLQINNSPYGINSINSTLTLTGLTLSGHSTAAVYADGGNLTVHGSTLSGSGYGVWGNGCDSVTIDNNCTLSGNGTGLYADQIVDLQVTSTTFTANTTWGANVIPKAAAGLCVIFDNCTFHNNFAGLTLLNAVNGQVSLRSNTMFRDNTNSGLHFASCNLTVNDQVGGTAWQTLRNGYGISSIGSTLILTGISVEESGFYGVRCEDSTVSLANCDVTGVGGIYANSDNDSLTVESTRLAASSSGGWGVARYGGNLEIKNCVLDGFDSGIYLSTALGGDQAAVKNSTLVNLANDGVHLEDGDATVQNTILVGNNASNGLTQVSGLLTHSYNLLQGFGTPFSGTTADASELLTNPLFVDAAGGDFKLAKGSPAINSGTDLTASGVAVDMVGSARPTRGAFEIGAYEYTQAGGSLRVLNWKEER